MRALENGDRQALFEGMKLLMSHPEGRHGFGIRLVWGFVESTKGKVLPSQYQLLVAIVTEGESMDVILKQKELYHDGWNGFSNDLVVLREPIKQWLNLDFGDGVQLVPSPQEISFGSLKDLYDVISFMCGLAEEEKERLKLN